MESKRYLWHIMYLYFNRSKTLTQENNCAVPGNGLCNVVCEVSTLNISKWTMRKSVGQISWVDIKSRYYLMMDILNNVIFRVMKIFLFRLNWNLYKQAKTKSTRLNVFKRNGVKRWKTSNKKYRYVKWTSTNRIMLKCIFLWRSGKHYYSFAIRITMCSSLYKLFLMKK